MQKRSSTFIAIQQIIDLLEQDHIIIEEMGLRNLLELGYEHGHERGHRR